jgi:hypothetical protein
VRSFFDKITIKYIGSNANWNNFISSANIPFAKITTFQIKVGIIATKQLVISVATREAFGFNIDSHKDFLGYYCGIRGHGIFDQGFFNKMPGTTQIANGVELSVKINRSANTVSWMI